MAEYVRVEARQLRLLRPQPVYLLFTGSMEDGTVNIMAESWVTPISKVPPAIGVVVEKRNLSWSLLQRYPWFSLAIPGPRHAALVKYAGTWSGREVDKVKRTGVEVVPWEGDPRIPLPLGFLGVLIVKVSRHVDFTTSTFFAGHVVGAYADPNAFDPARGWNCGDDGPLLHLAKHTFTVPCRPPKSLTIINTPWGVAVKKPWRGKLPRNT